MYKKKNKLDLKIVQIFLGSVKATEDDVERMKDILDDEGEGVSLTDEKGPKRNPRDLARRVFEVVTRTHYKTPQEALNAARAYLQEHEIVVPDDQPQREQTNRRLFEQSKEMPIRAHLENNLGNIRLVQGDTEHLYGAVVHSDIYESALGDIIHVLDNNRHHFFVIDQFDNNIHPDVVLVRRLPLGGKVTIYKSIEPFTGLRATLYKSPVKVEMPEIVELLSTKMSDRINFPPCLYVGQEIVLTPDLVLRIDQVKVQGDQQVPFAALPPFHADINDIDIQVEGNANVNSIIGAPLKIRMTCRACGEKAHYKCGKCLVAAYCSERCQDVEWNQKKHKC